MKQNLFDKYEAYGDVLNAARRVVDRLMTLPVDPQLAFSGGKDAIVVAHLLSTEYGVRKAVSDVSMTFLRTMDDTRRIADQLGLACDYVDRFGRTYPASHAAKWVFRPQREQGALYSLRQHTTLNIAAKERGATVFGRRAQTNTVPSELYQLKSGVWQCHPIRSWTTNQVWSYIHDKGIIPPAIYSTDIARMWGMIPWVFMDPSMVPGGEARCWEWMVNFCPDTAREQAPYFVGAQRALSRIGVKG